MNDIKYDYTFMMEEFVGSNGISKKELDDLNPALEGIDSSLEYERLGIANDKQLEEIENLSSELIGKFDNLVVVGIGGAGRAGLTLHNILNHRHYNQIPSENRNGLKVYFMGRSTDPTDLHELFAQIDPKKTLFNVVSKSGTTVETMSLYLYIRNLLKAQVGEAYRDSFVLTAGQDGNLRDFVEKDGTKSLTIPESVGDRYAILTCEGLFPASFLGINIRELVSGGRNPKKDMAKTFAALQYLNHEKGRDINVLMPYSLKLESFAKWFRQIWAESLGKDLKGPTPIVSNGPEDQHSQIQLYQDGPVNKTVTFMKLEAFGQDYHLPNFDDLEVEGAKYFSGHSFSEIIDIEQKATALSLMKHERPNGTIILPEINEYVLGQLFFTFELATVYTGKLLEINPFDQPGVEESKDLIYGALGRKGYEKNKKELRELEEKIGKYII